MKAFSAYDESVRITKLIFSEIYAKEFSSRKKFDEFVIDLVKKNKLEGGQYTYYSLYLHNTFNVHVNIVIDNCFSPTTLAFCMIWNTDGDGRKCENRFTSSNTDNIATYIGCPGYWFTPKEMRTGIVVEEMVVEL